MSAAREEVRKLLDEQPDDSSSEEIIRELALHLMILRGIDNSDSGATISEQEMGRRIEAWSKQAGPSKPSAD